MLLLLSSWRAAVVALIVVPVSLMVAVCVLLLTGATFTAVTLLGLAAALGLVIDDVVTDLDSVRLRLAGDGGKVPGDGTGAGSDVTDPARGPGARGVRLGRLPLGYATLAILLALAPFLFLGTLATAFSRPLVLTYALAVLASMLVAFTLTPALSVLLLRGDGAGREGSFGRDVKGFFDRRLAGPSPGPAAPGRSPVCSPWPRWPACPRSAAVRCCRRCRTTTCCCSYGPSRGPRCRRWTGSPPPRAGNCGRYPA